MITLSPVEIIALKDIKGIDKTAEVNPMMSKLEHNQLKLSLEDNGQLEPIVTYRGFIVDGRNRFKALSELNQNGSIVVQKLPHKTLLKDKMEFVKMKETRRHQTATQKACIAVATWNTTDTTGMTQADFIPSYGVGLRNFANAQWLYKNNRQVFNALRDGNQVSIGTEGKYTTSDSLNAVVKHYKSLEVGVIPRVGVDVDNALKAKVGGIVNPLLDAMVISLNALNLSDKEITQVKEDIAKQMYSKFTSS